MTFRGVVSWACALAAGLAHASEFDGGAPELKDGPPARYSDGYLEWQISRGAEFACKGDRCELASTDSQGKSFTVEFHTGYGSQNSGSGGSGGVIIINGQPELVPQQPFVGVTLRYTRSSCSQQVNVPRSLYVAMNIYLYRLLNEDGSPERVMTPAQQTMILFYTTILNQAKGCSAPGAG